MILYEQTEKIRNDNSKSDSERDSIECWRNGEVFDGTIGSITSKGTQRCTVLSDTRTSSRRRRQYREIKGMRKYWKEANHCFSTAMLFKMQDWY